MIKRNINVIEVNKRTAVSGSCNKFPLNKKVHIGYNNTNKDSLFKDYSIRSGLKMTVAMSRNSDGCKTVHEIGNAPISLGYNICHPIRCSITQGSKRGERFERTPGTSVLSYLPETSFVTETPPCEQILGVSIHFSLETFSGLFTEIPASLEKLISRPRNFHPEKHYFYRQSRMNSETYLILRQIVSCPYHGETRRLFLEAKTTELVALKLVEMGETSPSDFRASIKKDTERIEEAYQILSDKLEHPPSLNDLSRQVGMNRNKLNNGFKRIYGDTVFNVLRNMRLENAWELLLNSEMSLVEIALTVGYNNQANFTNAFRRHFGKTPAAVRQNGMLFVRQSQNNVPAAKDFFRL